MTLHFLVLSTLLFVFQYSTRLLSYILGYLLLQLKSLRFAAPGQPQCLIYEHVDCLYSCSIPVRQP